MIITTFKSGGASGGTLASVFNMLDQPAAALKASSGPYSLNPPGSQQGPDGPDDFRVHYNQALRTWTVPSLFQVCDNRVVRRSNALLRYGEPPTPTNQNVTVDTDAAELEGPRLQSQHIEAMQTGQLIRLGQLWMAEMAWTYCPKSTVIDCQCK